MPRGKRARGPKTRKTPRSTPAKRTPIKEDETAYVLTTPGWEASGLPREAGRGASSPVRGRGRAQGKKSALSVSHKRENDSSEFETPERNMSKRGSPRKLSLMPDSEEEEESSESLVDESEEFDEDSSSEDSDGEEEEEESEGEEVEGEEDEEGKLGATQKRRRMRHPSVKANIATKVQRLRADPQFTGIRPETLSRVIEQFEQDPTTPSVIVNTTVSKVAARRKAIRWSEAEVENLKKGVARYGTSWSKILADPELRFAGVRTQIDLKDKWRNLHQSRMYSEIPIRRFVLVNENHEPILTDRGHYHIFNNRWPADAALKVATKEFIYGGGSDQTRIFLREIPKEGSEDITPQVHVFDVSRRLEELAAVSSSIPRFNGSRGAYVGEARKVCTERLILRDSVVNDLREAGRV